MHIKFVFILKKKGCKQVRSSCERDKDEAIVILDVFSPKMLTNNFKGSGTNLISFASNEKTDLNFAEIRASKSRTRLSLILF